MGVQLTITVRGRNDQGSHNRFARALTARLPQSRLPQRKSCVARTPGHLYHVLLHAHATTALLPQRHIHAGATAGGRGRSTTPSAAAETSAGAATRAVARDRHAAPRLARRLAGRGRAVAAAATGRAPRAAAVARGRAVRDAAAAAHPTAHAADRGAARPAADAAAAAGPDDL